MQSSSQPVCTPASVSRLSVTSTLYVFFKYTNPESDPSASEFLHFCQESGSTELFLQTTALFKLEQAPQCVEQKSGGHQGHQNAPSTLSLGSIPQASSFETRTMFLCAALKCFQIHPHYTHAHTRSYSRALALFPCRLFNLPPFFPCCQMKRILQAYTKTKGRSFWRLRKVCQWLFCQQPSHTKVLKTWQRIWSSLDLNIRKDKKTNESQWIKQTTESRWWKRCRGFIYYNTALTPKNNSLINILHNNGINSSLHW